MKHDTEVGLGPGHVVSDGDPAPPKGAQPPILAHVCCAQTAGWIRMPLGTDVYVGPGHVVTWGPTSPQKGGIAAHNFRSVSVVTKQLDG